MGDGVLPGRREPGLPVPHRQAVDYAERLPEGTPPIRELIFSAPKEYLDTLPEEVVDGLKFLGTAAGQIVYDTPEICGHSRRPLGIDVEVKEHLYEQDASDRAAEEDPDSPINRMRRRYQEHEGPTAGVTRTIQKAQSPPLRGRALWFRPTDARCPVSPAGTIRCRGQPMD